jgi:UDP-2-acetamido-2-deoxy-ribo-hexuluronate aminotransferase
LVKEAEVLRSDRMSSAFVSREIKAAASRCKVPLFDLTRQSERLGSRLTERMARVLDHGQFILGPEVAEFELALARYVDVRQAIEMALARGELRPKVAIPVDLYGLPADYAAIEKVAVKHGLTIVADAAQSLGAMVGARRVGTLAHVTAAGFYPTKPLGAFGDGGAILTNDDEVAEAVRQIRSHGTRGSGDVAIRLGMTGRLDTLQAAVLLAKLEVFDESISTRRRRAARYQQALEGTVGTPSAPDQFLPSWALYTLRVPSRDAVRHRMAQSGIDTGLYYRVPLHRHPAFAEYLTGDESLPISEQAANEVLSLPLHPGLSDADHERVIEAVARAVQ